MPRSAPPPPPVVPPPSAYKDKRQSELEALKQRGLARMLNKHFTSVTQALAEEKAAADAALRDLERRKANTSEIQTPSYGELSPYDTLYLELQQKKADCKKKERETLLLYQRYVNKFGNTGVVSVPFIAPDSARRSAPTEAIERPAPSKELVPQLATSIDKTVEKLTEKGADIHPSSHTMGMDATYQTVQASLEGQDRAFAKKLESERGVDARATPKKGKGTVRGGWQKLPGMPSPQDDAEMPELPDLTDTPLSDSGIVENHHLEGSNITLSTTENTETTMEDKSSDNSDENKSVVSGLTSVEGTSSEAELRLLEYLQSETEAIRQILDNDEQDNASSMSQSTMVGTSYSSEIASQTDLAAKKAEEMLNEMKAILAESQAQAVSAEVEEPKSREPYELKTSNPHEQWMVYYDENHQREYYHEVKSNTVQWECPVQLHNALRPATIPETLENSVKVSDFTKKSKGTTLTSTTTTTRVKSNQQLSYQDVMPEIHAAGLGRVSSSRRLVYRQMQRRRRRRRRRILVVASAFLLAGGIYYREHVGDAVNKSMSVALPHLPPALQWEEDDTFLGAISDAVCDLLPDEYKFKTTRKVRLLQEEAEQQERNVARAAAEKKAAQEAKKKAEQEKKDKEAAALLALEEEKSREIALQKERYRPWACNIPLAYLVHRRCWIVAKINPIFDLKELVQAMMQ